MKFYGQFIVGLAVMAAASGALADGFFSKGPGGISAEATAYAHSVAYGANLVEVRMVTLPGGKDFSTLVNGKVTDHFFMPTGAETQAASQVQFGSYIEASAKTISQAGANAADFGLLMAKGAPEVAPVSKFAGLEALLKAGPTTAAGAPVAKSAATAIAN